MLLLEMTRPPLLRTPKALARTQEAVDEYQELLLDHPQHPGLIQAIATLEAWLG